MTAEDGARRPARSDDNESDTASRDIGGAEHGMRHGRVAMEPQAPVRRSERASAGTSAARLGQHDGWGQGPARVWQSSHSDAAPAGREEDSATSSQSGAAGATATGPPETGHRVEDTPAAALAAAGREHVGAGATGAGTAAAPTALRVGDGSPSAEDTGFRLNVNASEFRFPGHARASDGLPCFRGFRGGDTITRLITESVAAGQRSGTPESARGNGRAHRTLSRRDYGVDVRCPDRWGAADQFCLVLLFLRRIFGDALTPPRKRGNPALEAPAERVTPPPARSI